MSYRVASKTDIERFLKPLLKEDVHLAVTAAVEPLILKLSAMAERIGLQQDQIKALRTHVTELEDKARVQKISTDSRLKKVNEVISRV